jgi:hypothetical protein
MELGLLFFLVIATMAFWLLIFLFGMAIPYWITLAVVKSLGKRFGWGKNKPEVQS